MYSPLANFSVLWETFGHLTSLNAVNPELELCSAGQPTAGGRGDDFPPAGRLVSCTIIQGTV